MADGTPSDIQSRLRAALPALPRKLALAARYALDRPERIALDSMRRSAGEVGVTSTTMLRLAREMGCEGYDDFRALFQDRLIGSGFGARAEALQGAGAASPLEGCLAAAEGAVARARAEIAPGEVAAAAAMLCEARRCYLVGSGSMHWAAAMMRTTGGVALPNLVLVGPEHALAAEGMADLGPEDVLVAFGIDPCALRTAEALDHATERGAGTLAITDRTSGPLAVRAGRVLVVETASPHYYPSIVPVVLLIEALLATVVAQGEGRHAERIRLVERLRRESGRYGED
jgi:DNA-binding MurR/RpiR family transcriptional regulator